MEADLNQVFGEKVNVDLMPSSGGVFEVTGDGELFFSKRELGRFPETGEVVTALKKKL